VASKFKSSIKLIVEAGVGRFVNNLEELKTTDQGMRENEKRTFRLKSFSRRIKNFKNHLHKLQMIKYLNRTEFS
jgi:hypothetical protein